MLAKLTKNMKLRRFRKRVRRIMKRGLARRIQNQVHHFKRTALIEDVSVIPGGGYNKGIQFSLDQLPNYSEFVALYDSYKIKSVVLRIEPAMSENQLANPQVLSAKYCRVVHDYDDAAPLGSELEYYEYGNMKSYSVLKPFKVVLYPKVSAEIYRSPLTIGYEQRKAPWLDLTTAGASIPHYGIKIFFPYLGVTAESFQFRILATFHVMCRQSK